MRGGISAEVVLAIPLVMALIVSTAQLSRALFVRSVLQNAVHEAGRYAILGHEKDGETRLQSVKSVLIESAQKMNVSVGKTDIVICSSSNPNCIPESESVGAGSDYISLTVTKQLWLPPNFSVPIDAFLVVKNEPFD